MENKTMFIGEKPIASIMVGEMGIKEIYLGDKLLSTRPGGYFYLKLNTEGETTNG